jgi:hypothetical protein
MLDVERYEAGVDVRLTAQRRAQREHLFPLGKPTVMEVRVIGIDADPAGVGLCRDWPKRARHEHVGVQQDDHARRFQLVHTRLEGQLGSARTAAQGPDGDVVFEQAPLSRSQAGVEHDEGSGVSAQAQ